MRVARRFVLSGRVQGVGFRYFTLDAARREGLHGYVTNRDDGSVEAVAEGDAESLERFERALRRGPSRVACRTRAWWTRSSPRWPDSGFEIR